VIPICFPLAYNSIQSQSCSTSTSATLVDETVETSLAPVVDKEKFGVRDDEETCRKGKGKSIFPEDSTQANSDKVETDAESVSNLPKRARGRRGHGRGRRSPTVADDA